MASEALARRRVVFGESEVSDFDEGDLPTEVMPLQMGPSHPAMHGTVRITLEVEGEKIKTADVQVGYLHRCFEKEAEYATWTQIFPYTDRLNYVSPMLNNVGYAMAVEKLLAIDTKVPERAQYIRVIVGEISRITDHLTCLAAGAMELGAFTVFFYLMKGREWLYELLEDVSGARLTHSYVRIGGVVADLPDGWPPRLRAVLGKVQSAIRDVDKLLTRNKIFRDRMDGVAVIAKEEAAGWGLTGPVARSTGLAYDVRKDHPYLVYDRFDFDVPVGSAGDNFDRYAVRLEEMFQSMRILEQALAKIPDGPIILDDPRVALPEKRETYNTIEAMIAHFKLVMDGLHVPAGEIYSFSEGGNGELGFYIVSDGTGRPVKCRVRPPCFANVSILPKLLPGLFIADVVPTFGMLNMIGGECDR
ncbi:MAG: NADH-quinone oxidoreductase subunit D [Deltaproteobacteria bacterium]|nr:NADH-quinone oxidoreductase subunit D [Deltaproteobacteria bacterium]